MSEKSSTKSPIVGWDKFGNRLKELGLKSVDAAHMMNCSGESVRKYRHGTVPQADYLYWLSVKTGKSMEWWLTGVERPVQVADMRLSDAMFGVFPFFKRCAQELNEGFREGDNLRMAHALEYAAEMVRKTPIKQTDIPPIRHSRQQRKSK